MKKTIISIALSLATLAAHAGIQIGSVYNGGTNNISAAAVVLTNNLPSATANTNYQGAVSFYTGTADSIYLQVSGGYANSTAGTGTVTVQFMTSVDNTIWTNSSTVALSLLAASTNSQLNSLLTVTNAPPFWCVSTVTAATNGAGAGPLTNLLIKAFTKTGI